MFPLQAPAVSTRRGRRKGGTKLIALEQVEKTYASGEGPVQALSGVSFTLGEGECWGIVGPAARGKAHCCG